MFGCHGRTPPVMAICPGLLDRWYLFWVYCIRLTVISVECAGNSLIYCSRRFSSGMAIAGYQIYISISCQTAIMTYVDSGLQPAIVALIVFSPCLASIFVALRLYTRSILTKSLNWEDSLIVISMVGTSDHFNLFSLLIIIVPGSLFVLRKSVFPSPWHTSSYKVTPNSQGMSFAMPGLI